MSRPAAFRIPVSAFLSLPKLAKAGVGLGNSCACGSPSWGFTCDRCSKRGSREFFLANWETRYPREEILDALLEAVGWTNRNYDFSEEREAFLAALVANAEPEEFRRILAEGGLDGIIEERDERFAEGKKKHAAALRARWDAEDSRPVPALQITTDEARVHARELLLRPRFWSGYNRGRMWSYQDQIYLQVLCIAGTSIERAAAILGRPESAVAWRAADGGLTLPREWRAHIASTSKREPASPRYEHRSYDARARTSGNAQLMEVNSLVAEYLPGRADICQEIMLALLEGKTTMEELRKQGAGLRSFIRKFYRENHEGAGYARSLDAPLTEGSAFSIMDTLSA